MVFLIHAFALKESRHDGTGSPSAYDDPQSYCGCLAWPVVGSALVGTQPGRAAWPDRIAMLLATGICWAVYRAARHQGEGQGDLCANLVGAPTRHRQPGQRCLVAD